MDQIELMWTKWTEYDQIRPVGTKQGQSAQNGLNSTEVGQTGPNRIKVD